MEKEKRFTVQVVFNDGTQETFPVAYVPNIVNRYWHMVTTAGGRHDYKVEIVNKVIAVRETAE